MLTNETITFRALQFVASDCDGARSIDGHGFSGYDAEFGHDIVRKGEKFGWSEGQFRAAKRLAHKYRKQIINSGQFPADVLDLIANEAQPERTPKPEPVDVCLRFLGVEKEYDRAIRFFAGNVKNKVCVPKSLIRSMNKGDDHVLVTIPDWFAKKEGLTYFAA